MAKCPTPGLLFGMSPGVNLIKGIDKGDDGWTSGYSTKCVTNF